MTVLRVSNVTIPVPDTPETDRVLVNNAAFSVKTKEILAIIGPNGAGKSSLLKAIDGSLAYQGTIDLPNISDDTNIRAKQVAFLPQQSTLSFPFTVSEVVELGRMPHATGKTRDQEIINDALALMDIGYLAHRRYTDLSGGEKQRVQLARVFSQIWEADPDAPSRLLILDEPTTSLDLGHQHQLLNAVKDFAERGVAVVMVMHDINLAARYADTLLALLCSEQIALGTPSEVIQYDTLQRLFGLSVEILKSEQTGLPVVIGAQAP